MKANAIEVEGLCKWYRRGLFRPRKQVLENVTFQVPQGSVFGFLGHNGAGKSTTIKVLLGFLRAEKGNVTVLGLKAGDAKARARIGYLPETADYYPFLTPRRLLRIYGHILGLKGSTLEKKIDLLLDMVRLDREKDERIGSFSKGMKQRVGIAQALLNDPDLLILDEPASGLDPMGQREIRDLIVSEKKAGRTIFFSSHELAEVEALCDEAAIVRTGRVVRAGTLSELVPYREQLQVKVRGTSVQRIDDLGIASEMKPQLSPDELIFIAKPNYTVSEMAGLLEREGIQTISLGAARESLEDTFLRLMGEQA